LNLHADSIFSVEVSIIKLIPVTIPPVAPEPPKYNHTQQKARKEETPRFSSIHFEKKSQHITV
jgi:hypothetical protein